MTVGAETIKALGAAIRWRRVELGHTQQSLGASGGLHASTISDMERGVLDMRVSTLSRVAAALDWKLVQLVTAASTPTGNMDLMQSKATADRQWAQIEALKAGKA